MRKTPSHNPRGFERNSWNYRVIQIRHALGWTAKKLSRVSGIGSRNISDIETGKSVRLEIDTIRKIKAIEDAYADIIKIYKKAPVRMDRLKPYTNHGHGVLLLPIEIRRPDDLETLGKVEGDSEPLFFGRGTRRKMQQAGMSVHRKARLIRNGKKISRVLLQKYADGWRKRTDD